MSTLTAPEFSVSLTSSKPLYANLSEVTLQVTYSKNGNNDGRTTEEGPAYTALVARSDTVTLDPETLTDFIASTAASASGTSEVKASFNLGEEHVYSNLVSTTLTASKVNKDNQYDSIAQAAGDHDLYLNQFTGADLTPIYLYSKDGFEEGKSYQVYDLLKLRFFSVAFLRDDGTKFDVWESAGLQISNVVQYVITSEIPRTDSGGNNEDPNGRGAGLDVSSLAGAESFIAAKTFRSENISLIETNLRMLNKGFGARPNGDRGVKWRSGFLHTFENNTVYPASGISKGFPHMYGFRFQYNPTAWTQNVSMNENIDVTNVLGSNPQNLPLLGNYAGIGLTVFINRIVEMDTPIAQLQNPNRWIPQGVPADTGVPYSDLAADTLSFDFDGRMSGAMRNAIANRDSGFTQKVTALKNYGTLADLEWLFKSVNGAGVKSYHRTFMMDGYSSPPSMDGNGDSLVSADYGFLNAIPIRIWLGPNITFVGRITSLDIQHLLFTEEMKPKLTQVTIYISRFITMGDLTENDKLYETTSDKGFPIPGSGRDNAVAPDTTADTATP